jgi:hypothetical protein
LINAAQVNTTHHSPVARSGGHSSPDGIGRLPAIASAYPVSIEGPMYMSGLRKPNSIPMKKIPKGLPRIGDRELKNTPNIIVRVR